MATAMHLPDYALMRIARESGCKLVTVRNYFAGRLVSAWATRAIERADKRLVQ